MNGKEKETLLLLKQKLASELRGAFDRYQSFARDCCKEVDEGDVAQLLIMFLSRVALENATMLYLAALGFSESQGELLRKELAEDTGVYDSVAHALLAVVNGLAVTRCRALLDDAPKVHALLAQEEK